jgi:hypothetical protein
LGISPQKYKSTNKRDTYISMLIATVFTTAKLWNQPRCPTMTALRKYGPCMYHRVLLSHKENGIISFARRWVELEVIILNLISQAHKAKYCISHSFIKPRLKMVIMMMMIRHERERGMEERINRNGK